MDDLEERDQDAERKENGKVDVDKKCGCTSGNFIPREEVLVKQ